MEPIVPSNNNPGAGIPAETTTPAPPKRGRGRPPFPVTDENRARVLRMAKHGITQKHIAIAIAAHPKTLRKRFGPELAEAALDANLNVLDSLYDMATSRRNTSATIFWTKTRCASLFTDPVPEDDLQTSETKPPKPPKSPDSNSDDSSDRVVFTVYNNDGEPNADY